ncbi:hypothetical protein WG66_014584 [Moniliophthora roreri]|nr:hypothetical protein WG66_014584 [Moniliophthora roreri]
MSWALSLVSGFLKLKFEHAPLLARGSPLPVTPVASDLRVSTLPYSPYNPDCGDIPTRAFAQIIAGHFGYTRANCAD